MQFFFFLNKTQASLDKKYCPLITSKFLRIPIIYFGEKLIWMFRKRGKVKSVVRKHEFDV